MIPGVLLGNLMQPKPSWDIRLPVFGSIRYCIASSSFGVLRTAFRSGASVCGVLRRGGLLLIVPAMPDAFFD